MANVRGKIFCQRCRTANKLGDELCSRCGTRLMLMFEPTAARFEGRSTQTGMEEHLLERVTAIENNISRLIDKLERMAELMLKQSRSAYFDHVLLDTLVTVLTESGVVSRKRLHALWRERYHGQNATADAEKRRGELSEGVIDAYAGDDRELFTKLVREGFGHFAGGKTAGGVRELERAAAMAKDNAPLNAFLGEHFFGKGKMTLAHDYLARALEAEPENARLRLLLGIAVGDEGETERARALLYEAVSSGGPSFAAHCSLGRLAAAEGDWKAALAEFKRALAARDCPEAHYLLGLANYNLNRDRTALRHLKKAVEIDADYGEAFYLLSFVQRRLGQHEQAKESLEAALALDAGRPRPQAEGRKQRDETEAFAPSLFAAKGRRRRKLLTGGDARLAAALRDDALGNVTPR
jgi:tetratricopeptide (TPR) repeat protein